ncbi:MAG: substrate-binding domain-containing protein [Eubacteriales bacterium]|nr:substrate-binding domain-containing protein [Eubacteriales bacterium]
MSIQKSLLPVIAAIIVCMLTVEGAVLLELPERGEGAPETVIGLVLTDCEDDWKQQMYDSIQQAARQKHIQVTAIQTARTQSDQIDAIRTLLVYRTNAIIFSPVMENGWEYILSEAAEAEIPLITINERLSQAGAAGAAADHPVYHIGFDYYALSGQLAATLLKGGGEADFELVQLGGTVASSAAHDISDGFRDAMAASGRSQTGFSVGGDYMRSRAYELVTALLRNEYRFDAILSYNDGMTLGAIAALRENGLKPGRDVRIFSLGGGEAVLEAFGEGQISALGRCDLTDFGETVIGAVRVLQSGGTPPASTLLPGTLLVNGGAS